MAKGKKLLTILVTDSALLEWDELKALEKKGHSVLPWAQANETRAHLIMGPECHMMDESLRKYIPLAVKEAQERVYDKKGVQHGVEDSAVVPEASHTDDADTTEAVGEAERTGGTEGE